MLNGCITAILQSNHFPSTSYVSLQFLGLLTACFSATASNRSNRLTLRSSRRNQQEGERGKSCGAQINFKTTYQVIRHRGHKGIANLLCKESAWGKKVRKKQKKGPEIKTTTLQFYTPTPVHVALCNVSVASLSFLDTLPRRTPSMEFICSCRFVQ